ncbi:IS3 family transposase [Paenibacillus sp. B2(2019)]
MVHNYFISYNLIRIQAKLKKQSPMNFRRLFF